MQQEKEELVKLNEFSQPYVLQKRMEQAGLKHGDTVIADIKNVRVDSHNSITPVMYFCPTNQVEVKQKLQTGDDYWLPDVARIIGDLKISGNRGDGLYHLRNVKLHSNGTIQIIAMEETFFEPVPAQPYPHFYI
jgi:hypothetical protein